LRRISAGQRRKHERPLGDFESERPQMVGAVLTRRVVRWRPYRPRARRKTFEVRQ
jgi:hypothetical protein